MIGAEEEMLRKMTDIQDSIEKERAMAELNRAS